MASDPLLIAALNRIAVAVEGLRGDLRRQRADVECHGELGYELASYFGSGDITVSGIFAFIDDNPHHRLAAAVADVVDLNSENGRATRLGMVLASLPTLELVTTRRNAAVYRVRT